MPKVSEGRIFLWFTAGISLLCFAGFARSYYLRIWLGTRGLPPVLHVHGVIMTAWMVLLTVQIVCVAKHRVQLHKKLGTIGAFLAVLVVTLGVFIIVHDIERQSPTVSTAGFFALFVAFDGMNLLLFGSLVWIALWLRRRSDIHKRLMLTATLSLLPPALGRIAIHFVPDETEPIAKLAMLLGCLVLVVVTDSLWNRRLHPALGWGITALLVVNYATYLAQIST